MKNEAIRSKIDWEELLYAGICICAAIAMVFRSFFGTELTDEVYAVSDTLAAMYGNLPFAFNTSSVAGQALVPMLF